MTLSRPRWARGTIPALCLLACMVALPSTAGASGNSHRHTHSATHRHRHRAGHKRSNHHFARRNRARHGRAGAGVPRDLAAAARAAVAADRQLVLDARALRACFTAHGTGSAGCAGGRALLQRAGSRFSEAELHLAAVAGRGGTLVSAARFHRAGRRNPRTAPALAVTGYQLRW